jgi:hypothetical protein
MKDCPKIKKKELTGSPPEIVVLCVCTTFFAVWTWFGLSDGVVGVRRGREYSFEKDPVMYFFIEGVHVFCLFMGVYYSGRSIQKKLKKVEKPNKHVLAELLRPSVLSRRYAVVGAHYE